MCARSKHSAHLRRMYHSSRNGIFIRNAYESMKFRYDSNHIKNNKQTKKQSVSETIGCDRDGFHHLIATCASCVRPFCHLTISGNSETRSMCRLRFIWECQYKRFNIKSVTTHTIINNVKWISKVHMKFRVDTENILTPSTFLERTRRRKAARQTRLIRFEWNVTPESRWKMTNDRTVSSSGFWCVHRVCRAGHSVAPVHSTLFSTKSTFPPPHPFHCRPITNRLIQSPVIRIIVGWPNGLINCYPWICMAVLGR